MVALRFVQPEGGEWPLERSKASCEASFCSPTHSKSICESKWIGVSEELRSLPIASPDEKPQRLNTCLSANQFDTLTNRREQRRVLNLWGLPSKLCTAEALHVLFRAGGLGDAVENLKVIRGKAGRLGCAVVRTRTVADMEKLAKFFHGYQFGAGSSIVENFVASRGQRGSLHLRRTPSTMESSVDKVKQLASPCLIPGSVSLLQSPPDLAMGTDVGVLKESRPFSGGNIMETGQIRPPPGLEDLRWQ